MLFLIDGKRLNEKFFFGNVYLLQEVNVEHGLLHSHSSHYEKKPVRHILRLLNHGCTAAPDVEGDEFQLQRQPFQDQRYHLPESVARMGRRRLQSMTSTAR